MELLQSGLVLIFGLVLLIKCAEFLIRGSSDLARYFKISPIIVGLTIVAIGTSLPELVVSLFSVFTNNPDISIGNIVGSNIANIGLILGIGALIRPLTIKSSTLYVEFPFLIISALLLFLLGNDFKIINQRSNMITHLDGLFILFIFVVFIVYIYRTVMMGDDETKKEFAAEFTHKNSLFKNLTLICIGIIGLYFGGQFFMYGILAFAGLFQISNSMIGLSVVAISTSLPELFVTIVAAIKKESDIAIGNILGSNIFNVLFVIGISGIIHEIPVNQSIIAFDGIVMLIFSFAFLFFAMLGQKITRFEGGILLFGYLLYIVHLMSVMF